MPKFPIPADEKKSENVKENEQHQQQRKRICKIKSIQFTHQPTNHKEDTSHPSPNIGVTERLKYKPKRKYPLAPLRRKINLENFF